MSKLAQKMLSNNGITPKTETDNNGNDTNQSGGSGGASGAGEGDGGGDGDGSPENAGANNSGNNNAAGEGNDNNQGGGAAGGENQNPAPPPPVEIDEATIIKALSEKHGITVASLSELKPSQQQNLTADELEELEQVRQNNIRAYALQTGKVTTTLLDKYIRESSLPTNELAFSIYKADRVAELKEAKTPDTEIPNDEALLLEFNELNFQMADPTDPKRKQAEKRMLKSVDDYLQTAYEPVYQLEDQYNQHQDAVQQRSVYNTQVAEVLTSIGDQLEFEVTDDKQKIKYPVKLNPEEIKAVETLYGTDEMFSSLAGKKGVTKEVLTEAVRNSLIGKHFNKILDSIATAHASAKVTALKLGRREIFTGTNTGNDAPDKKTKAGVKQILDRNKK